MSLLKRIERARPAEGATETPAAPGAPAPETPGSNTPATVPVGPPSSPTTSGGAGRAFLGSMPARESFREAKYRVQNRLINELDPKLDLTNQVEVRRQIEQLFGKIADE